MIAPVAVTCGDPAGIGPDLVLQLQQHVADTPLVILGDLAVLRSRAQQLGINALLHDWQPGDALPAQGMAVWHQDSGAAVIAGQPNPAHAASILTLLDRAAEDRKSTRLNSSHVRISYAVFCLKKKNTRNHA